MEERAQVEVTRNQSQLFQDHGGALEPYDHIFFVKLGVNSLLHGLAIDQMALNASPNRQPAVLAGEIQKAVDGRENRLRFRRRSVKLKLDLRRVLDLRSGSRTGIFRLGLNDLGNQTDQQENREKEQMKLPGRLARSGT